MERAQGRAVKMAMDLARNEPDYISKMEVGKRSIKIEATKGQEIN